MKESEVYGFLTEIFHNVFMRDDIVLRPELTASDVAGWDSFKQIEIILATQERFGIKLSTKELDRLERVGDLVDFILAKISSSRSLTRRLADRSG